MNPAYVELAKLALMIFFMVMQQANQTPEEQEAFYQAEKAKFKENKPEDLPDLT